MFAILRAASDFSGLRRWLLLLDQRKIVEQKTALPCSPRGLPGPAPRPPHASAQAAFVSPALNAPQPLCPRRASVAAGNQTAQQVGSLAFAELLPLEAPAAFRRENSVRSQASRPARPHAGAGGLPRPAPPARLCLDSTQTLIFGQRIPSEHRYYSE